WAMRFFIVDVIGGKDLGRAEKVAWEAPIVFGGSLIWFRFSKFGMRAWVYNVDDEVAAENLMADCLRRLGKAVPVVSRDLISPLIEATILRGDFTVPNKFQYFLGMFEHLRSSSDATAESARQAKPIRKQHRNGASVRFPAHAIAQNSEYEAVAALFALFSLLEHLLVIGFAFGDFDPGKESFSDFLRLNWGDKYRRVVGVKSKENKAIYDILKTLADGNRNPAAHGGVDRNVTNIQVHLPGYGAVSTGVNAGMNAPEYTFRPQVPADLDLMAGVGIRTRSTPGWDAVDRVLAWMETGPLTHAFTYGRSGLPVWFDARSRQRLRDAVDEGDLDGHLDYMGYQVDQAANMDW
ncbi:MAG: hypothetical protein WBF71_11270, partial [Microthrixaceae bacterium]